MYETCCVIADLRHGADNTSRAPSGLDRSQPFRARRNTKMKRFTLRFAAVLLACVPGVGQNTMDGLPAFVSTEDHGDYIINLQNLDVVVQVPIRDKTTGAIPFHYALGYDSECTLSAAKWYCGYNNPTPRNLGLLGLTAMPTKVGFPYLCPDQVTNTVDMSRWVIVSSDGKTQYPLPVNDYIDSQGCWQRNLY